MSISITAPAKLTTRLKITGLRADGFHLIDAEMVSLDLCDRIEIMPGQSGVKITGPYADGVPTDRSTLVHRALEVVGVEAGVTIHKQIPNGGGLGGGSSDAAAILRWAGFSDLVEAARIGADVAYCLIGGRAHVSGIGEVVVPLDHIDTTYTLVIPPLAVSTPAAYAAFDELAEKNTDVRQRLINDLEPAALAVEPRMKFWRAAISEACGSAPTLAGSGATWFLRGDHRTALLHLEGQGAEVVVAQTIRRPV
jgi:4-diphosphocytidyl-2-C-methyl-D-erythritol kinase